MRSKKSMTLLLVSLLAISVVAAGCSKGGKEEQASPKASASTSPGSSAKASEAPPAQAPQEHLEITVSQWDAGQWEQSPEDTWLKELGEKFNVTFKPVAVTWDDWLDKTRLWAASGNLPDMFVHDENYMEWVKQGLFKPIPLDMLDQYPNIKQTISPNVLQALTVDGNIYSIPRSHFTDASQAVALGAIYVRKDFLEKAGLSAPPDTLDGWYDFLKKAVTEDYGGKGNTIGIKGSSLLLRLPFMHADNRWIEEGGKWIPSALSQNHIEELKFSRKLFEEGLMDRDFATRKVFDERKLFQQGRLAVIEANGDPGMLYQQVTPDMGQVSPMDFIQLSLPPKAADGNRYFPATLNYFSYTGISSKVSDAKLERILAILDFLGSPEGQVLSVYGKQGKDFKSKSGTEITSLEQSDDVDSLLPRDSGSGKQKDLHEAYPSSWFGGAYLSWNTWANFLNPVYAPEVRKMSNDYFNLVRSETTRIDPNLQIQFMSSPKLAKMPDMNALYNEEYVKIVMGKGDVAEMFNDWVEKQIKKVGDVIEEVNANLKS